MMFHTTITRIVVGNIFGLNLPPFVLIVEEYLRKKEKKKAISEKFQSGIKSRHRRFQSDDL